MLVCPDCRTDNIVESAYICSYCDGTQRDRNNHPCGHCDNGEETVYTCEDCGKYTIYCKGDWYE